MAVQHAAALLYQFYTAWKSSLLISYLKPAETTVWPPTAVFLPKTCSTSWHKYSEWHLYSKSIDYSNTMYVTNLIVSCKLIVLLNCKSHVYCCSRYQNNKSWKSILHVHFKCLCAENIGSCKNNFCTFVPLYRY